MDNSEVEKKNRSKKIAYVLGGIALVWYVVSMFTVWNM
jgi:hypothetical protein